MNYLHKRILAASVPRACRYSYGSMSAGGKFFWRSCDQDLWYFPQLPSCSPATEHDFYARFSSHPRFSYSINGNAPAAPAYWGLGAFPLFGSAFNCGYSTELLQLLRYFEDEFQHNEMVGYTKYTQRHVYRVKITFSKLNFRRFAFIFNNFRYTLSYAFSNASTNT